MEYLIGYFRAYNMKIIERNVEITKIHLKIHHKKA